MDRGGREKAGDGVVIATMEAFGARYDGIKEGIEGDPGVGGVEGGGGGGG